MVQVVDASPFLVTMQDVGLNQRCKPELSEAEVNPHADRLHRLKNPTQFPTDHSNATGRIRRHRTRSL